MNVTGLGWVGTRTSRASELAEFYQDTLGLSLIDHQPGFWAFGLPAGGVVEVFSEDHPGKDHLTTGPVVGFIVSDLDQAVARVRAAGLELVGERGPTWQHFRGPDGNVYQLTG